MILNQSAVAEAGRLVEALPALWEAANWLAHRSTDASVLGAPVA
jgi:hypothetical protein